MPDLKELLELLQNPKLIEQLFGGKPPEWVSVWLQPALAFLLLVALIGFLWKNLRDPIRDAAGLIVRLRGHLAHAHAEVRRQLADYLRIRLRRLADEEGWNQKRFTELEGDYYPGLDPGQGWWTRIGGPRRRKALSESLKKPPDSFAILEGAPGSGKSVLLRQAAVSLCERASRLRAASAPIGLYVNLKTLERHERAAVDRSLIKQFVLSEIDRFDNPRVSEYVRCDLFTPGRGGWVLLFDSFDEIPDVLNAEDASETIDAYAQAILDFSTTVSNCRTILATRHFRRPKQSALPKYRVRDLSDRQHDELIRRALLTPEAEGRLYDGISAAAGGIRRLIENPMYLGLLIEYVRQGERVPTTAHELFARFIDTRLDSDAARLHDTYGTNPASLRLFAEGVAFTIASDSRLALSSRRRDLLAALGWADISQAHLSLDALEHLRLARGDTGTHPERDDRRFTFSHRRFQEYFATSYVQKAPDSVCDRQLLEDPRWRETARWATTNISTACWCRQGLLAFAPGITRYSTS